MLRCCGVAVLRPHDAGGGGLDRLDPPKRYEPRKRAQPDLSGGYEPAFSDVTLIVFTPSFSVTSPVASTFFATKSRSLAFLSFV